MRTSNTSQYGKKKQERRHCRTVLIRLQKSRPTGGRKGETGRESRSRNISGEATEKAADSHRLGVKEERKASRHTGPPFLGSQALMGQGRPVTNLG